MKLCAPAMVYVVLVIIWLVMNLQRSSTKEKVFHIVLGIIMVYVLQTLCKHDMKMVSWLIVALPIVLPFILKL